MSIHKDFEIKSERVLREFDTTGTRRVNLSPRLGYCSGVHNELAIEICFSILIDIYSFFQNMLLKSVDSCPPTLGSVAAR